MKSIKGEDVDAMDAVCKLQQVEKNGTSSITMVTQA